MVSRILLKTTEEYRLETEDEVDAFKQELRDEADENDYQLTSFTWTKKEEKSKGEIIAEYYHCKAIKVFNTIKEPENDFSKVYYKEN